MQTQQAVNTKSLTIPDNDSRAFMIGFANNNNRGKKLWEDNDH